MIKAFPNRMNLKISFLLVLIFILAARARADTVSELLAHGDQLDIQGKISQSMNCYLEAQKIQTNNAEILWRLSRETAYQMFDAANEKSKQSLAESALHYAQAAVEANPKNAKSHLSIAICYGKLVPFVDHKTQVAYSKLIRQEAEKAAELDPSDDLTYHVLGVWNTEIASMNPVLRAMARIVYGGLPKGSHEAAIENFRKAISLNPKRIVNHFQLAKALQKTDLKKEAIAEWKICTSMNPLDKDDLEARETATALLKKWSVK
ncbi:MAG: hypothetical protein JWM04_1769 [Verrucomicrobiales bacterium]|jgi:tetratricopeptide (TPR) repeat protein|nr:hypothetical protein [Verrucomicrobiales bacterium]